jgi:hypothetical protein
MKKQIAALAGAVVIAGTIGVFVSSKETGPQVEAVSDKEYKATKDTYVIAWNDTHVHAFELQDGRHLATGMPNVEFFEREEAWQARKEYLHNSLNIPMPEPEPELDRTPPPHVEPRTPPRKANIAPAHNPRPTLAGQVQRGDKPPYFGICVGDGCKCAEKPCLENIILDIQPSGGGDWQRVFCEHLPEHTRCIDVSDTK